MQSRNTLTALRGEGDWGETGKKVKGLSDKNIHVTHRHRQQGGDSQKESAVGVGGGGQRG